MNLIVQEDFKTISSPWLYDFRKDLFDTYGRLSNTNQSAQGDGIPSDYQLIDELMAWCHEAASLFCFSDPYFYRTLDYNGVAHEMNPEDFYSEVMSDHYDPYVGDVYKAVDIYKLSLFLEFKGEYINLPILEVW